MKLNLAPLVKLLGCVLLLLTSLTTLKAQQLPQYTQFAISPYLFNPALAGTEGFVHIQSAFRSQWRGFEGAPKTGFLALHAPVNNKMIGKNYKGAKFSDESWMGMGGIFTYDHTGPLSNTAGYLTLSYNMPLANQLRLSFGVNGGFQSFVFRPGDFLGNVPDQDDPLLQGDISNTSLDFAAGVWLYSKSFFLGFSTYQFLENPVISGFGVADNFQGRFLRHYFGMVGLKVDLDRDLFAVPSLLVKQLPSFPMSYDINMKVVWQRDYWVAASYRNQDSFALAVGLVIQKRLEFGYSYDLITSGIRNDAFGSSEFSLGYRLFIKPKVVCPDEFW